MSEIIDKAMILFSRHEGRETQNIFRSMNRAAAALAVEQACWSHLLMFDMRMLKVFLGQRFSYYSCIVNAFYHYVFHD